MQILKPYLVFLGDAADSLAAKTALGVVHWRPDDCVGQLRLPDCQADAGLEDLTLEEARERGAETLLIGVANRGGVFSPAWADVLMRAADLGYDIASGLHEKLDSVPGLANAVAKQGRNLIDVRHGPRDYGVASGIPRTGRRLLAVGTDCSVGKMYTTLALEARMLARGRKATFRATGQTGIFIAGTGVAVDAVVADFISGATEYLSPANAPNHWDLIEGQGSLFHPSFAGVSLGLLHGAQAEALVMCHEPRRPHMRGLPGRPLPDMATCIRVNEEMARLTCPQARVIGFAVNTKALSPAEAQACLNKLEDDHGLPAVDPVATGVDPLIDALPR